MEDVSDTLKKMETAYTELAIKIDDVKTVLFSRHIELISLLKKEVVEAARELNRESVFKDEKIQQLLAEHENYVATYAQLLNSWKNLQESLPKVRKLSTKN